MKNFTIFFSKTGVLLVSLALGFLCASPKVGANDFPVGTLTFKMGKVEIYENPTKIMPKTKDQALFEGSYYRVREVQVGEKVASQSVVRTAIDARAKLVFDQGDQIVIGPGSFFKIGAESQLRFGSLRAVVNPEGALRGFKVKTKSATMGVRGTDFFIKEDGAQAATQISVMRGKVEAKPQPNPARPKEILKTIEIKPGFSADIPSQQKGVESKPMVYETSKNEVIQIQKASSISKEDLLKVASESLAKDKLIQLEETAKEATLKDIKKSDPELYNEIQAKSLSTSDQIQQAQLEKIYQAAPVASPSRKASRDELDEVGNDAYERYFKKSQ